LKNDIVNSSVDGPQVVVAWAITVVAGMIKFLQWSSLLSSWKGIAFSAATLGLVTVLMHILVSFSQAERSTPAKVAPAKRKTLGETSDMKQEKQH